MLDRKIKLVSRVITLRQRISYSKTGLLCKIGGAVYYSCKSLEIRIVPYQTTLCSWSKIEDFSVYRATEKDLILTTEPRALEVPKVVTN
jgi:hypothetical protein